MRSPGQQVRLPRTSRSIPRLQRRPRGLSARRFPRLSARRRLGRSRVQRGGPSQVALPGARRARTSKSRPLPAQRLTTRDSRSDRPSRKTSTGRDVRFRCSASTRKASCVLYGKSHRARRRVPLSAKAMEAIAALPPRVDTALLLPGSEGAIWGSRTGARAPSIRRSKRLGSRSAARTTYGTHSRPRRSRCAFSEYCGRRIRMVVRPASGSFGA
jgi:hypothetical protein